MRRLLYLALILNVQVLGQLIFKKEDIDVPIGREVYLEQKDIQFFNSTYDAICKIEVVNNEPMTQQVGILIPEVFDCSFNDRTVKYVHHGSPLLSNDTVKMRAYKLLEHDTIWEYFDMTFFIKNTSYDVIQLVEHLVVHEFFGLTKPIDDTVLAFNVSRKEGALCKVKLSRNINYRPAYGQIVVGKERRSVDVIKRKCNDFLQLGLRYEHLKPPSPNIDFIVIIVEVSDPNLNNGELLTEWYQLKVIIEPGFPNLPPKASFSGMYLMDVDQFIITAITPAVLSATDSETSSDQLVFNISKPLLSQQGSIVHLSDHTRPISSFTQHDLNNFDIAYKPPARSFKDRQMFEIGFVIRDPDFAFSKIFTMHIAIRPAITTAPRVSMNAGMVLLEGQSRPLRVSNLEILDSDNVDDVKIYVTAGGLHHGRLEVDGKPAVEFTQHKILSEAVVYYHDDSDSVRDSIHLRISDGFHSTSVKFPITIIPKDDNSPVLVINIGLKVKKGSHVQISPSSLHAVDQDTMEEHIKFNITKLPLSGSIQKKFTWEKSGREIKSFTQLDVNKGLIYYYHNSEEVFTDSFEIVLEDSNNPPNLSPPNEVFIRIMPGGEDPPKRDPACLLSMEVKEVDIGIFTAANLHYMDMDSHEKDIIYTVTTEPRFIGSFAHSDPGKLVWADQVLLESYSNITAIKIFSQEQINHHKVAYIPPAKEIGPNLLYLHFIFSVVDKDKNIVTGQIFNITILPENNQIPRLHTGELLVEEGSSTLLSTNELSVYDPDTLSSDLQISLFTVPLFGSLCRSDQILRVGDLLSLDDILTLRLEYTHDGSEHFKDSFKVGVNDGLHFVSGNVRVLVEPVDDEQPSWRKDLQSEISVVEGGKVEITTQVLAATDVDTEDLSLYFILTEVPQLGNIFHHDRKTNRFSQKDLVSGEIFYIHNGLEIGPNPREDLMTFIVTDKAFPRLIPHNSHKVSVTILPQNTKPPRLYFKRAILVEEGKRSRITEENISAADDDTFPNELLIVVTKQPDYGYLENSRPTPGYEKITKNKKITAFLLQDIKNGFVTFIQSNHSGIEPESDDFEILVTDGAHNSTSVLVYISIILLNDEIPLFHLSNISVDEGDSFIMNNDSVLASDKDFPGDILVINVVSKPKHGSLTHFLQAVNKGPMFEVPFNQLAVENFEKIVYHHDGSEQFTDSFTLSLNDGMHSVAQTCFITIIPKNDEPPFVRKNIRAENVKLNSTFIISSAVLLSEDKDSPPSEIFYKIMKLPSYGELETRDSSNEWVLLDLPEFSQEEINLNLIRYRQILPLASTAVNEDHFTFFLYDGLHNSSSSNFTFEFTDYEKNMLSIIHLDCVVERGEKVQLNSTVLFAFDNRSNAEDILFYVLSPPSHGNLSFFNESWIPLKSFTALDIQNNRLFYYHNGALNNTSDSFTLEITNGEAWKNVTLNILILNSNNTPILKISPLEVVVGDVKNVIITNEHLLFHELSLPSSNIIYMILEYPKFGFLFYNKTFRNPKNFSQYDIEQGHISYSLHSNASRDKFEFQVLNKANQFSHNNSLLLKPTWFEIAMKHPNNESMVVFIESPTNLENVWHRYSGFLINTNNLKAMHRETPAKFIYFKVKTNLEHCYLFHIKHEKIVKDFSQDDINNQFIAVILKNKTQSSDYFTFNIAVNGTLHKKEYRMDIYWAVVYFPHAEYFVCEDVSSLNITVKRSGNTNISSYVTITSIAPTAVEGLDYISKSISKLQFDPGAVEMSWKIIIVKDDLEEAPIEQLQITLLSPENCVIGDYDRTVVSIYDLNRDSCSQMPLMITSKVKADEKSDIQHYKNDREEYDENKGIKNSTSSNFPMKCNQNIYGLLHFDPHSQNFFQCDGKEWQKWYPEGLNNQLIPEIETPYPLKELAVHNKSIELTTMEIEPTTILTTLEAKNCLQGWQEFEGSCFKWHRPTATWNNAQMACRNYPSGSLAAVESLEHNSWLLELGRNKPFWIGLHTVNELNDWQYFTPNDVSFQNWRKGFPKAELKYRCVLVRGSGSWINKNCDSQEHSYICVIPLDEANSLNV